MKKILLALILCITVATLALSASAVYSDVCGDVRYSLDLNMSSLVIYGEGAMENYSSCLSVPWYEYRSCIEYIKISEGITSIGDHAFYDCGNLTSIIISDSVTSIGTEAFRYCDSLTSISIPDRVTSIGN